MARGVAVREELGAFEEIAALFRQFCDLAGEGDVAEAKSAGKQARS